MPGIMTQPYLMVRLQLTVGGTIVAAVALAGVVAVIFAGGWCSRRWAEKRMRRRHIKV